MKTIKNYISLLRLDKPAGIWLLFWPCSWGLLLGGGEIPWVKLALFACGAIFMRSAGCIINDLVDRKLDAQVERTRNRPLASGAISVNQAITILLFLLLLSLGVASLLGQNVINLSCAYLPLVLAYPFMKRITWWPQLFLGITFNAGVIIGWISLHNALSPAPLLLYFGSIFWTLGYDTIYAHQDKIDDAKVGIKSTARILGKNTKIFVGIFYAIFLGATIKAGWDITHNIHFLWGMLPVAMHLYIHLRKVDLDNPQSCLLAFKAHCLTGGLIFFAIFLSFL